MEQAQGGGRWGGGGGVSQYSSSAGPESGGRGYTTRADSKVGMLAFPRQGAEGEGTSNILP